MNQRFEPVSPLVRAAAIEPAMRSRVALVLAALQDRHGPNFPASLGRQAELVGLDPEVIRTHVKALVELGVLEVTFNPNCKSPAPLPGYQFNKFALRSLAQSQCPEADMFDAGLPPRLPFLAVDADGASQLMALELHGQPGQRIVRFVLESRRGDIPYGQGPLRMLLLPSIAEGAWTGELNPSPGSPAWASPVHTCSETAEDLRQWAQETALGHPEGSAGDADLQQLDQKQKGNVDGH